MKRRDVLKPLAGAAIAAAARAAHSVLALADEVIE